jgi:hypothetical protein
MIRAAAAAAAAGQIDDDICMVWIIIHNDIIRYTNGVVTFLRLHYGLMLKFHADRQKTQNKTLKALTLSNPSAAAWSSAAASRAASSAALGEKRALLPGDLNDALGADLTALFPGDNNAASNFRGVFAFLAGDLIPTASGWLRSIIPTPTKAVATLSTWTTPADGGEAGVGSDVWLLVVFSTPQFSADLKIRSETLFSSWIFFSVSRRRF